jgi:FkbM family methyltransferase
MAGSVSTIARWDWAQFSGSATALHYNQRDVGFLDAVVALTKHRRACVQAGGHLGIYPKRLAQDFGAVYTFEPDPELFRHLMVNAPESNIVKFQAAVGFVRKLIGLARNRRDGSTKPTHEGLTHVSGEGQIPTLQIDDLALPVCDLIQLDVEGYELLALMGADATVRRCRPVIMVEINKGIEYVGFKPDDVRLWLDAHGYRKALKHLSDEVYVPNEWRES